MIKIGITGQSGFVGTHLYNYFKKKTEYLVIPFENSFFKEEKKLRNFVKKCDVIIHLAAMMRSPKKGDVYDTNMKLVSLLIDAIEKEKVIPSIIFSSSIQEGNGSEYGRCKEDGRNKLYNWALEHQCGFVGVLFPNLFGPGATPNSHSYIATFCYKLIHNEIPQILVDDLIPLKYIGNVLPEIEHFVVCLNQNKILINKIELKPDFYLKVSETLSILEKFKKQYMEGGIKPSITNNSEKYLFETFKSYI